MNSAKISISVVVPVMNCARTVGRSFDSILHQTLQPTKIIVVYDTSRDNTLEVVQSYRDKHPNLFVLIHGTGKGTGVARHAALQVLETDYVSFLDGDDWYMEDALENLYQNVSRTGAVCGLVCKVYPNGERVRRKPSDIDSLIDYETLKKSNPIAMSSTMFDSKLIKEIGGFDENLLTIEDYDLHLRVAQVTSYYILKKVISFYTVYPSTNMWRTYYYAKWSAIIWRKHGFVNYHALWNTLTSSVLAVLLVPTNLVRRMRRRDKRIFQIEYIQILMGYIVGLAIGYRPKIRRLHGKKGLS